MENKEVFVKSYSRLHVYKQLDPNNPAVSMNAPMICLDFDIWERKKYDPLMHGDTDRIFFGGMKELKAYLDKDTPKGLTKLVEPGDVHHHTYVSSYDVLVASNHYLMVSAIASADEIVTNMIKEHNFIVAGYEQYFDEELVPNLYSNVVQKPIVRVSPSGLFTYGYNYRFIMKYAPNEVARLRKKQEEAAKRQEQII